MYVKVLLATFLCIGCLPGVSVSCKRQCEVESWGAWSSCSQSSGTGYMTRTRLADCEMKREQKKCYTPPGPRRCSWAGWGQWSSCSMLNGRSSRSRSRNVSSPALYDGARCSGMTYQIDDGCRGGARVDGQSDAGTCSDPHRSSCESTYPLIPNIAITAAGYDIIKDEEAGYVLNNSNFCGECDTEYLGEFQKSYRRPYNVQSFRSSTEISAVVQVTSFRNILEMSDTKNKEFRSKISSAVSYTYANAFNFGANAARTEESKWKKIVETSTSADSVYFTISNRVEIGQFQMNRHNLMLDSQFRIRIGQLPTHYDYAKYYEFLSDFGTHYYARGKLGGTFKLILEYSRSTFDSFRLTEEQVGGCLKLEHSASIPALASASFSNSECSSSGSNETRRKHFSSLATKTDSIVRGGTTGAGSVPANSGTKLNADQHKSWADSIKHNPAVIDFELKPISYLVENRLKRINLERALAELFEAYDPDNCGDGTCKNGGKFVVTDHGKICTCLCLSGYSGVECDG